MRQVMLGDLVGVKGEPLVGRVVGVATHWESAERLRPEAAGPAEWAAQPAQLCRECLVVALDEPLKGEGSGTVVRLLVAHVSNLAAIERVEVAGIALPISYPVTQ